MSFYEKISKTKEFQRLQEDKLKQKYWRRWGPYLSERQWGTVREDYSSNGDAWNFFPHDHARSRVYRWGEDGIAGISDNHQHLCFSVALWNTRDPILKERLFGLTGPEGNHGEDVKEQYYYLDNTPTHAYMKYLYKYPQQKYPYDSLLNENRKRNKIQPEFEILDTGIFDNNEYFVVFTEYAKASPEDICIRITVTNRHSSKHDLHLLPTLWLRNTWSWTNQKHKLPTIILESRTTELGILKINDNGFGAYKLYFQSADDILFTNNGTNFQRLFNSSNASPFTKDGINDFVVEGRKGTINRDNVGSKAVIQYILNLEPNESKALFLRLTSSSVDEDPFVDFDKLFTKRIIEANDFYDVFTSNSAGDDLKNIQRQAFAGLLWSKQFYYFDIKTWLQGDEPFPRPPANRFYVLNAKCKHVNNDSILSMPEKW